MKQARRFSGSPIAARADVLPAVYGGGWNKGFAPEKKKAQPRPASKPWRGPYAPS